MSKTRDSANATKDELRRQHLSRKGEFRSYYVRMLDEDEFQSFAPETQRAFFYVKGRLGQWGVDVMYPAELAARMRVDLGVVNAALEELTGAGWFRMEKNVCWLVHGLRHEPWYEGGNENQLAGLKKFLRGLPQVPLLTEIVEAYSIPPADSVEDAEEPAASTTEAPGSVTTAAEATAASTATRASATEAATEPVGLVPEKRDPNRRFDPDEDLYLEDGRLLTGGEFVRLCGANESTEIEDEEEFEEVEWEGADCAA